jgi:hypothetical protein
MSYRRGLSQISRPAKGWWLDMPAAEFQAGRVPEKFIRFFRYEVVDRWNQLSPEEVALLHGDLDELANLLQERYDFTIRRAQSEVQSFRFEFESKIRAAKMPNQRAASAPSSFVA